MTGNSQKTSDPGAIQGIMLHNTVKHMLVSGHSAFRLNRPPGNMYSIFVKQTSVSMTSPRMWRGRPRTTRPHCISLPIAVHAITLPPKVVKRTSKIRSSVYKFEFELSFQAFAIRSVIVPQGVHSRNYTTALSASVTHGCAPSTGGRRGEIRLSNHNCDGR